MKRWIVHILVALALLIVLSPGIVGLLAERNVDQGIAARRQESPAISISTEHFERGWMHTVGRHRVELSDREAFPVLARFVDASGYRSMPALVISSRLDHGLIPLSSMTQYEHFPAPRIGKLVSTMQFDPGDGSRVDLPIRVVSNIGLTGHTRGRLHMTPGSWTEAHGTVQWGNADIAFSLSPQGALTGATGRVEPVRLVFGDQQLAVGTIDLNVERSPGGYGFMTGSVMIAIEHIETSGAAVSGLRVSATSALADDELQGRLEFRVEHATVPEVGQAGITVNLRYRGLDAGAFALVHAAVRDGLGNDGIAGVLAGRSPSVLRPLQQLLAAGGQLDVDRLAVELPQGEVAALLQLAIPDSRDGGGSHGRSDDDTDLLSWPGILLKTTASMTLRVPAATYEAIVADAPQANAALAAGFLAKEGSDFTMRIEIANGMARINGAPMPLSALLQERGTAR